MTKEYLNDDLTKATTTVQKEIYSRVKRHFYYGQFTKLLRNILESIDVMIKEDKLMQVVGYIQKKNSVTFHPVKDINEDENQES